MCLLKAFGIIKVKESIFFDTKVFCPLAQFYHDQSLGECYKKNEEEKKCKYDQSIREIKHGSFSPLNFSTTGGTGPIATISSKEREKDKNEKSETKRERDSKRERERKRKRKTRREKETKRERKRQRKTEEQRVS